MYRHSMHQIFQNHGFKERFSKLYLPYGVHYIHSRLRKAGAVRNFFAIKFFELSFSTLSNQIRSTAGIADMQKLSC